MLSHASLDQIHAHVQDRLAEAQHAALVHEAISASAMRHPATSSRLRLRVAGALRDLACRLDSSLALPA